MPEAIRVEGLAEFQRKLKLLDGESQKEIRLVLNDAAELIVTKSRSLVPRRTGAAAASIRAQSTQRQGRVKGGNARTPYYPWLDFGGSVGRNNSVKRPFYKDGRYIYKTFDANRDVVQQRMVAGLDRLIRKAGL